MPDHRKRPREVRQDPAVESFLSFLARDIEKSPQNLKTLSPDLAKRIASLVEDIEVDVDAPIDGDVDL